MQDDPLLPYYSARASEYERIYQKPERQGDLRRLEQLMSTLFVDASVLEVACGTGYWTRLFGATASRVVATDISEETLKIAKSKRLDPARIEFCQADAYALPDALGRFDAAFAGFWWSHVPIARRAAFLAALGRRLRPGAKVVLLDNRYVEGSNTPISGTDDDGNTYQQRRLDDGSEHRVLKNFPTAAQLRADLQPHGQVLGYLEMQYYWMIAYLTPKA